MNRMPLVHQARRTLANHRAGNPFADRAALERDHDALAAAYLDPRTDDRSSRAIHAAMDARAEALDDAPAA